MKLLIHVSNFRPVKRPRAVVEVFARIDVVAAKLRDVQREDLHAFERHSRLVADMGEGNDQITFDRLTLNVGVRYEYETAMRDSERRLSRFMDFSQGLPDLEAAMGPFPEQAAALRRQPLNIVGAWIFTDDNNPGTWNPQKNIILPRAGVAIRAGRRSCWTRPTSRLFFGR